VSSGGNTANTNFGFGLRAALGKEWWGVRSLGAGLVGHLSMSSTRLGLPAHLDELGVHLRVLGHYTKLVQGAALATRAS